MKFIIQIVLVSCVYSIAEDCSQWFKKSKLDSAAKSCFIDCLILPTGMDTYGCPMKCHELCKLSKRVWVYFGNGMFNSEDEANQGAAALNEKLGSLLESKYPDLPPIVANIKLANVAYNFNETVFLQLLEVYIQKMGSDAQKFMRWLSDVSIAPEWFRSALAKIGLTIDDIRLVVDEDLREHLSQYSEHLKKGDAVVIVPHSQGNVYAAAAYQQLYNNFGFNMDVALVRVADIISDDDAVNSHYANLYSDWLVRVIRGSDDPNVRNHPSGIFDHQFIKHYLNGNGSGPKILMALACVISVFRILPPNISTILGEDVHQSCKDVPPDELDPEVEARYR